MSQIRRKERNKEMKRKEEGRGRKEGGKVVSSERNRKIKMNMGLPRWSSG